MPQVPSDTQDTLHVSRPKLQVAHAFFGNSNEELWSRIHQEQGDEAFKDTFAADRTALVVAGALLMTVDFAALTLNESSYAATNTRNSELTILFMVTFGIACASALGSVWIGSFQFITIHKYGKLRPREVVHYLEASVPSFFTPVSLMIISIYTTIFGTAIGMYLLHGLHGALAFGVPCLSIFSCCGYYAGAGMAGAEQHLFGSHSYGRTITSRAR